MKKIMFNDKYGLTAAVLKGYKTMTRRAVDPTLLRKFGHNKFNDRSKDLIFAAPFRLGEVVAVAQKYLDLRNCDAFYEALSKADPSFPLECIEGEKGCRNKMFVKAEWMPHRIRITDIKVERLQDISDEDAMDEGVYFYNCGIDCGFTIQGLRQKYGTAKAAFAALIDKISGKGTWNRNPYVFAYTFKLED